jgi:hypothetical protein
MASDRSQPGVNATAVASRQRKRLRFTAALGQLEENDSQ